MIHTRNISTPDYGIKLTGTHENHTFAGFVANDERLNIMIPGNLRSEVVSLKEDSENLAARYRFDASKALSIGATSTLRQSDDYHNSVVSIDSKYKPNRNDTFTFQYISTDTEYSKAILKKLCDDDIKGL